MTLRLEIDKYALDIMAVTQVEMREEVGSTVAACEQALQKAEAQFELTYARLLLRASNHPLEFGIQQKPTDSLIKAAVTCSEEYQQAQAAVHEARHALKSWKAVDSALDDRRRMLESLVALHGRDYWADVSMSADERAAIADSTVANLSVVRRRRGK